MYKTYRTVGKTSSFVRTSSAVFAWGEPAIKDWGRYESAKRNRLPKRIGWLTFTGQRPGVFCARITMQLSINDIANELGMTKAGLYHYSNGEQELLSSS
jgi:hypothetical protein